MNLDTVRDTEGQRLYPVDRLEGLRTALMGFCAAFMGRQDCVWVADAGMVATGVDIDPVRVAEMAAMYPKTWRWHIGDLFDYAEARYAEGRRYDLVNMDPPSGLFQAVADETELWCALAGQLVILGTGRSTRVVVPDGWRHTQTLHRSTFQGGVYWTVLER